MLGHMVGVAREFRPDVVHAFLPEHATIFGAVAKIVSKARVFIANRLSERKVYRSSFLMGKLERCALRYANVMVGNSAPIIEEIARKTALPPNTSGRSITASTPIGSVPGQTAMYAGALAGMSNTSLLAWWRISAAANGTTIS